MKNGRNGSGRILGILAAAACLAASAPGFTQPGERDPKTEALVGDFAADGWNAGLGLPLRDGRFSLKSLESTPRAAPDRMTLVEEATEAGAQDELYELQFEGMRLAAVCERRTREDCLPLEVEITEPNFRVKHGLDVGVPFARVVSVLGPPDEIDGNVRHYASSGGDRASFLVTNGVVSRIHWQLWLD